MPRVSVVLPVFNAAATVARAVESIRAQTWRDWELVAVDDGSTDGTKEILDRWARDDARARVVTQDHAGVATAANTGLAAARGELIARMDADDVAHPERLARQVALLDADATLGVASSLVEFGGDRAARAGYALHVDWLNSLVTPEEIALNRFVEAPVANPSVLFRRELVERHGPAGAGGGCPAAGREYFRAELRHDPRRARLQSPPTHRPWLRRGPGFSDVRVRSASRCRCRPAASKI